MRVKLKDIFDLQMGKTPSRSNLEYWNTTDYKWISIADLTKTSKYIFETKEYLSKSAIKDSGIKVIPANTVVMSFKLSIGKTAITKEDMYSNEAIMAFKDKHVINIIPEYIFYLFKYKNWEECSNKAVMGKTLNKATLSEIEVEICSIEKQRQIVNILDKIMSAVDGRKQELQLLDELIKARFVELFGDIRCNNKLPLVKLSEFVNIGSSKRIYANEYVDKGVPFYRSKEIRELGTGMKPSVELYIKQERYDEIKEKYGVPKKGDILIAAIGATIGYSWIVDTDTPFYYKDGNLIILSIKNNVNPIFLNYTMRILIEDFKNKDVAGSAQLALTIEKLEKMMVVNPDIKLQNQFADFVHQVNKSKVAVQKALDETQILFDSLMQKYFG